MLSTARTIAILTSSFFLNLLSRPRLKTWSVHIRMHLYASICFHGIWIHPSAFIRMRMYPLRIRTAIFGTCVSRRSGTPQDRQNLKTYMKCFPGNRTDPNSMPHTKMPPSATRLENGSQTKVWALSRRSLQFFTKTRWLHRFTRRHLMMIFSFDFFQHLLAEEVSAKMFFVHSSLFHTHVLVSLIMYNVAVL